MTKRIYILPIVAFVLFLFHSNAFAGVTETNYWCDLNYGSGDAVADLNACCYPKTPDREPYMGQECSTDNTAGFKWFLTNYASKGLSCTRKEDILAKASDAKGGHRKQINCFTGGVRDCTPTTFPGGYCDNGSACVLRTAPACTEPTRRDVCPGGCGPCASGKIYCNANNEEDNPLNYDGATLAVCKAPVLCTEAGKQTANYCTGACKVGCGEGYVESGEVAGKCMTFKERFDELLKFGLASLGGKELHLGNVLLKNSYAYGSLGDDPKSSDPSNAGFYGRMFVEADQSDHLNWASSTVPAILQGILANAGYQFCGAGNSCPVGTQICTAGLCNTPGASGIIGVSCKDSNNRPNSSLCNMGLLCDPNTQKCINPSSPQNELISCTSNSDCSAQPNGATSCVLGFCHNQTNGPGAPCASGLDSQCAAGLICNASLICVSATDTTARFVGLTSTGGPANDGKYKGAQTDYKTVDALCNTAFKGSHACFSTEIINSYIANVPTISNPTPAWVATDVAWVNAAVPGNTTPAVNDCNGWTDGNSQPFYGTVWNFFTKSSGVGTCSKAKKFACCK